MGRTQVTDKQSLQFPISWSESPHFSLSAVSFLAPSNACKTRQNMTPKNIQNCAAFWVFPNKRKATSFFVCCCAAWYISRGQQNNSWERTQMFILTFISLLEWRPMGMNWLPGKCFCAEITKSLWVTGCTTVHSCWIWLYLHLDNNASRILHLYNGRQIFWRPGKLILTMQITGNGFFCGCDKNVSFFL